MVAAVKVAPKSGRMFVGIPRWTLNNKTSEPSPATFCEITKD